MATSGVFFAKRCRMSYEPLKWTRCFQSRMQNRSKRSTTVWRILTDGMTISEGILRQSYWQPSLVCEGPHSIRRGSKSCIMFKTRTPQSTNLVQRRQWTYFLSWSLFRTSCLHGEFGPETFARSESDQIDRLCTVVEELRLTTTSIDILLSCNGLLQTLKKVEIQIVSWRKCSEKRIRTASMKNTLRT